MKTIRSVAALLAALAAGGCSITSRTPATPKPYEAAAAENRERELKEICDRARAAGLQVTEVCLAGQPTSRVSPSLPDTTGLSAVLGIFRNMTPEARSEFCADLVREGKFRSAADCERDIEALGMMNPSLFLTPSSPNTPMAMGTGALHPNIRLGGKYLPPESEIPDFVKRNPGCPSVVRVMEDWHGFDQYHRQWYNTCQFAEHEGIGVCHEQYRQGHFPIGVAGSFNGDNGWDGTPVADGPEDCYGQWVMAPWDRWGPGRQSLVCDAGCHDDRSKLAIRVNFKDSFRNEHNGHWGWGGKRRLPGMERCGIVDHNGNYDLLVHVTSERNFGCVVGGEKSGFNIRW